MYRDHTVAVVVPAYNEAGLVGEVIDTVPSFVDRVYVIDDRSTDGTWEEIREHAERANAASERTAIVTDGGGFGQRVVPLRNEQNRGVGYTIVRGYRQAIEDGVDVVAVMNGDGQMDPDELDRILDPVVSGEADYAKGDRLSRPEHHADMSAWRLFGNQLLTVLTRIASGHWHVTDTQNGYTAISREALEEIPLDELYDHYGFLNDVIVKLRVHGFRIADVPHQAVYGDEQSGIQYHSFVPKLSALLLRDFLWRLKHQYLLSGIGAALCFYAAGAAGVLGGALLWIATLLSGVGSEAVADAQVAPAAVAVGLLSIVLAVGFDVRSSRSLGVGGD